MELPHHFLNNFSLEFFMNKVLDGDFERALVLLRSLKHADLSLSLRPFLEKNEIALFKHFWIDSVLRSDLSLAHGVKRSFSQALAALSPSTLPLAVEQLEHIRILSKTSIANIRMSLGLTSSFPEENRRQFCDDFFSSFCSLKNSDLKQQSAFDNVFPDSLWRVFLTQTVPSSSQTPRARPQLQQMFSHKTETELRDLAVSSVCVTTPPQGSESDFSLIDQGVFLRPSAPPPCIFAHLTPPTVSDSSKESVVNDLFSFPSVCFVPCERVLEKSGRKRRKGATKISTSQPTKTPASAGALYQDSAEALATTSKLRPVPTLPHAHLKQQVETESSDLSSEPSAANQVPGVDKRKGSLSLTSSTLGSEPVKADPCGGEGENMRQETPTMLLAPCEQVPCVCGLCSTMSVGASGADGEMEMKKIHKEEEEEEKEEERKEVVGEDKSCDHVSKGLSPVKPVDSLLIDYGDRYCVNCGTSGRFEWYRARVGEGWWCGSCYQFYIKKGVLRNGRTARKRRKYVINGKWCWKCRAYECPCPRDSEGAVAPHAFDIFSPYLQYPPQDWPTTPPAASTSPPPTDLVATSPTSDVVQQKLPLQPSHSPANPALKPTEQSQSDMTPTTPKLKPNTGPIYCANCGHDDASLWVNSKTWPFGRWCKPCYMFHRRCQRLRVPMDIPLYRKCQSCGNTCTSGHWKKCKTGPGYWCNRCYSYYMFAGGRGKIAQSQRLACTPTTAATPTTNPTASLPNPNPSTPASIPANRPTPRRVIQSQCSSTPTPEDPTPTTVPKPASPPPSTAISSPLSPPTTSTTTATTVLSPSPHPTGGAATSTIPLVPAIDANSPSLPPFPPPYPPADAPPLVPSACTPAGPPSLFSPSTPPPPTPSSSSHRPSSPHPPPSTSSLPFSPPTPLSPFIADADDRPPTPFSLTASTVAESVVPLHDTTIVLSRKRKHSAASGEVLIAPLAEGPLDPHPKRPHYGSGISENVENVIS
eukprot:GCRY01002866.1.p1 GENE.GCRY01002866.1~~GCRY01002866.1.p1  ORF type:complete len:984 (-),score=202.76 GCRY01002866.1:418-3369(-)